MKIDWYLVFDKDRNHGPGIWETDEQRIKLTATNENSALAEAQNRWSKIEDRDKLSNPRLEAEVHPQTLS